MVHNPTEFHLLRLLDTHKKTEAKYNLGFQATRILSSHILTKKTERKKRKISNIESVPFFSNVIVESCVNFP